MGIDLLEIHYRLKKEFQIDLKHAYQRDDKVQDLYGSILRELEANKVAHNKTDVWNRLVTVIADITRDDPNSVRPETRIVDLSLE